jgi:hypothetical protein
MRRAWSNTRPGFSVVEAILSASIFALLVTAFVGAYLYGQEATALGGNRARAALLAEEGIEAARNIRDSGFANLADGTYGLAISGGTWILSGASDAVDIFTRRVTISSVDADRKLVTSRVAWQQNPQRTGLVEVAERFTNWMAATLARWEYPFQEAAQDAPGTNDGIHIQTQGNYAYLIRSGGAPNFLIYDVGNPAAPTIAGSLTLSGTPTNIAVFGNYAYVSNQSDSQELQIISIAAPMAPAVVGTYNAPGTANANGIAVAGTVAYLVRSSSMSDEFLVINITNPSSPALLDSLDVGATAYSVAVVGDYAYVANGSNSQEVRAVNIANPSVIAFAGSLNLSGTGDATAIAGSAGGLVIGQGSTLGTVNITNPAAPVASGSLSIGGTVNDIALGRGNTYAFLGTSVNTGEFQVVDITSLAAPMLLSTVNVSGSNALNGIAYNEGLDRAFGASAANTQEFLVFAPQ